MDFDFHFDERFANGGAIPDINQFWRAEGSSGARQLRFNTVGTTPCGTESFSLAIGKPLTDNGGTIPLNPLASAFTACLDQVHLNLTAGALVGTVIPEPSSPLFIALGLAALAGFSGSRTLKLR